MKRVLNQVQQKRRVVRRWGDWKRTLMVNMNQFSLTALPPYEIADHWGEIQLSTSHKTGTRWEMGSPKVIPDSVAPVK